MYAYCTFFIQQSVHKWIESPSIISMENAPIAVGTIPFPAVTVCSSSQVKPSVFNLTAYFMLSDEEKLSLNKR